MGCGASATNRSGRRSVKENEEEEEVFLPTVKKNEKKKAFEEYNIVAEDVDEGTGENVTCTAHLRDILEHICDDSKTWTDDEVKELFKVANISNKDYISFRTFMVAVCMGYFLKVDNKSKDFLEIKVGFQTVQDAFRKIDKDNDGKIKTLDLKQALFSVKDKDASSKDVLEARFKELDYDENGTVNFPEFLYGMSCWVSQDDKELEETRHGGDRNFPPAARIVEE